MHLVDAVQNPEQLCLVPDLAAKSRHRQRPGVRIQVVYRHAIEAIGPAFIEKTLDKDPIGRWGRELQIARNSECAHVVAPYFKRNRRKKVRQLPGGDLATAHKRHGGKTLFLTTILLKV